MSEFIHQLRQVEKLQARMQAYYSFYQQNKIQEDTVEDMNQFLAVTDSKQSTGRNLEQEEKSLFGPNHPYAENIINDKIVEDESQNQSIYQSHLLNNRSDVGLSRIFGDIVLGDEIDNHDHLFEIQLNYENSLFNIELSKKDEYSLSNFSSFNNQVDNRLDFGQLIEKIQMSVGKKLSKAGVDKIIGQINEGCINFGGPEESSIRMKKMSQLSDVNLLNELEDGHEYDNRLNFQRNKNKKSTVNNLKDTGSNCMEGKTSQNTSRKLESKAKFQEEKENRAEERLFRLGPQKSFKLTRKSKQTIIHYRDNRQVEQFCITNKLFGKQKDKLMRAINADKSHLVLQ